MLQIPTPRGTAGAEMDLPDAPHGLLVLGHGAGGGIEARDLQAVRSAAVDAGWAVARILQPYRLAGRRAPAPAPHLDDAFGAIVADLRARVPGVPLVVGGRSSGARVACRTAAAVGASGVLALSFPLHPPGKPERSRAAELLGVTVPVLVVQGERDPFGGPEELAALDLPSTVRLWRAAAANHGFAVPAKRPPVLPDLAQASVAWLTALVAGEVLS